MPWLALGSPILAMVAHLDFENATLTFISGCKGDLGSERVFGGREY